MSLFRDHPHPHSFGLPCPASAEKLYLASAPPTLSFITPKRLGHGFLRPLPAAPRAAAGGRGGPARAPSSGNSFTIYRPSFYNRPGLLCGCQLSPRSELVATLSVVAAAITGEKWGRSGKVRRGRERKRVGGGRGAASTCAVRCRTQFFPRESATWSRSPATWVCLSAPAPRLLSLPFVLSKPAYPYSRPLWVGVFWIKGKQSLISRYTPQVFSAVGRFNPLSDS